MPLSSPPDTLIDLSAARDIALAQVSAIVATADVSLAMAAGCTAARDVMAGMAMPFFTNSAVDGFALRADPAAPGALRLPIVGTIAAGDVPEAPLRPGTALRIFTGAPLPEGAESVVPVEDTREDAGFVQLSALPAAGANLRLAGSDQPAGARLLARGTRIAPHHVGLLAANGIGRVEITRRPRVAVLSTGDELAAGPRAGGQVYDCNRPMLLALAEAAGAEVLDAGVLPDAPAALAAHLAEVAAAADLIVTSGGVSMGGRDVVRPAFVAAGGHLAAWRVAVKPGKPVMFGRLGDAAFTGLPGNPFAAFVGFHLFVAPQIARLAGREPRAFAPALARADFSWTRRPGRAEVFPVRRIGTDPTVLPLLERLGAGVSATLFPLAEADGLAIVPADTATISPGDLLHWQPFEG